MVYISVCWSVENEFPGPTKPDGSVNFTCHCVGHLVASPCGHEFREAAICQRAHKEEEFEAGACADEFMQFMQCVMKTECFKCSFSLFRCLISIFFQLVTRMKIRNN